MSAPVRVHRSEVWEAVAHTWNAFECSWEPGLSAERKQDFGGQGSWGAAAWGMGDSEATKGIRSGTLKSRWKEKRKLLGDMSVKDKEESGSYTWEGREGKRFELKELQTGSTGLVGNSEHRGLHIGFCWPSSSSPFPHILPLSLTHSVLSHCQGAPGRARSWCECCARSKDVQAVRWAPTAGSLAWRSGQHTPYAFTKSHIRVRGSGRDEDSLLQGVSVAWKRQPPPLPVVVPREGLSGEPWAVSSAGGRVPMVSGRSSSQPAWNPEGAEVLSKILS